MDNILKAVINGDSAVQRPSGLTDELIAKLNDASILRYAGLLTQSNPNIRRGEVKEYLTIHLKVRGVGNQWDKMSKLGKYEVSEAYYDEYGYPEEVTS